MPTANLPHKLIEITALKLLSVLENQVKHNNAKSL